MAASIAGAVRAASPHGLVDEVRGWLSKNDLGPENIIQAIVVLPTPEGETVVRTALAEHGRLIDAVIAIHEPSTLPRALLWAAASGMRDELSGTFAWEETRLTTGEVRLDTVGDLSAATGRALDEISDRLSRSDLAYTDIVKLWWHLPREPLGVSRAFAEFNEARYAWHQRRNLTAAQDWPHGGFPATVGVGIDGGMLRVAFMAASGGGRPIDNPLQTRPDAYSSALASRPALFSRATFVPLRSDLGCVLVSGTASIQRGEIVGASLKEQVAALRDNLDALLSPENLRQSGVQVEGSGAPTLQGAQLYVPPILGVAAVQEAGAGLALPAEAPVLHRSAELSRDALLVELDGWAVVRTR